MKRLFLITVLIGCLLVSSLSLELFPENHQFLYHYKGHLRTGVTKPSHYGNFWEFEGHLHVEGGLDGVALFKMTDIHMGSYNGEITKEEFHSPDPLVPVEAHVTDAFNQPWMARFRDGLITEFDLGTNSNQSNDLDNMKRSITSLLQIDLLKLNDKPFNIWDSKEENAIGSCVASYTTTKTSPDEYIVKKFIDHAKCKNHLLRLNYGTSLPKDQCLPNKDNLEKSSNTQRKYFLSHPKENPNKLKLTRIESSSANLFLPFRHYGNAKYSYSTQKLKLESSSDSIETKMNFSPGKNSPLNFIPMKQFYFKKEEGLDILDSILKGSSVNVEGVEDNVPQIYMLKRILNTASKEQLKDFFIEVINKGEIYKQFLMNSYGLINTQTALEMHLELYKEYKSSTPILNIVQTIEYPNESCLDLFTEEMLKDQQLIIPFSILLGRICDDNCKSETLLKWTTYFFEKFQESTIYSHQVNYLFALQNIRSPDLIELLSPIIRFHSNTNIRYYALDSVGHLLQTKQIYDLSWPIFINRTEPVELRQLSMKYLMFSRPTPSNLLQIYWFLDAIKDGQIYTMFSNMIDNLSKAHNPCLQTLKAATHYIDKFVKRKETYDWSSNWMLTEFIDEEIGIMNSYGFASLATSDSFMPNMYVFTNKESALGLQMVNDVVLIKGDQYFDYLYDSNQVPTLESVLKALERVQLKFKENVQPYLDLVIKRYNRVISFEDMTTETLNNYKNQMKNLLLKSSGKIQKEFLNWQWHIDNAAVSDLGTIVKNQIDFIKFNSFLLDKNTSLVNINYKMDFSTKYRFSQYKFDSIKSLNPFRQQVHTVTNTFEDKFNIKLEGFWKMIPDQTNQQIFLETTFQLSNSDSPLSYKTESKTSSFIYEIQNYAYNNTVTYHVVPLSPKIDMENVDLKFLNLNEMGMEITLTGEHINFFDSEFFEQIITSLFQESRFLGYVGSIFNIIPYLKSHRNLVNLATSMKLDFNINCGQGSEIYWKMRLPERIEDSNIGSKIVYRLMPENKELISVKTGLIYENELYKFINHLKTAYNNFELASSINYYDNKVDPYNFVMMMNISDEDEGKSLQLHAFDSWYVKENVNEIWPIEICSELMNPVDWFEIQHEYNDACDKAWDGQSYNITVQLPPLIDNDIIIERDDKGNILILSDDYRIKDEFKSILGDLYEMYIDQNIGEMDGECVANIYHVITWDGNQQNMTKPLNCYHLLVSDTQPQPQYAIWYKQMDPEKNLLSLKIYSSEYFIELIPNDEGGYKLYEISDNSKKVELPLEVTYINLETKHVRNRMVIYLDQLSILTNGHYIYILGDFTTRRQVNGICGTFDDDPTNDIQTNDYKDCQL